MKPINSIEQEIDKIRLEIYEETKNMTLSERNERLERIVDTAQKQYGFKRADSAN